MFQPVESAPLETEIAPKFRKSQNRPLGRFRPRWRPLIYSMCYTFSFRKMQ